MDFETDDWFVFGDGGGREGLDFGGRHRFIIRERVGRAVFGLGHLTLVSVVGPDWFWVRFVAFRAAVLVALRFELRLTERVCVFVWVRLVFP